MKHILEKKVLFYRVIVRTFWMTLVLKTFIYVSPDTFILRATCPDFINKDKQNFQPTIVNTFLPIIFNIYVLVAQKNRLIDLFCLI